MFNLALDTSRHPGASKILWEICTRISPSHREKSLSSSQSKSKPSPLDLPVHFLVNVLSPSFLPAPFTQCKASVRSLFGIRSPLISSCPGWTIPVLLYHNEIPGKSAPASTVPRMGAELGWGRGAPEPSSIPMAPGRADGGSQTGRKAISKVTKAIPSIWCKVQWHLCSKSCHRMFDIVSPWCHKTYCSLLPPPDQEPFEQPELILNQCNWWQRRVKTKTRV